MVLRRFSLPGDVLGRLSSKGSGYSCMPYTLLSDKLKTTTRHHGSKIITQMSCFIYFLMYWSFTNFPHDFAPTYKQAFEQCAVRSVMKEAKTRVSEDDSQFLAGLNHDSVSSGTGRSSNIRHATLSGEHNFMLNRTKIKTHISQAWMIHTADLVKKAK